MQLKNREKQGNMHQSMSVDSIEPNVAQVYLKVTFDLNIYLKLFESDS